MQADLFVPSKPLAALTLRVLAEPDDGPGGEPWPERQTAFSVLLQPCGSCQDAIPVLGPRVCDVCFHLGYCPICGCHHGARLCPEVADVIAEQEAIELAAARQRCQERVAAWTVEDWDADTKARRWSRELAKGLT